MPPVNVITPEGATVAIPEEAVESAIRAGFRLESAGAANARATLEGQLEPYQGTGAAVQAAVQGGLRGITLGISDVLQRAGGTPAEELSRLREANPTISTGFEIGGAVLPSLLSGGTGAAGAAARLTPSGALSSLATRVATPAAGAGSVAKVARATAGGALEGAGAGAGSYLTEVALEDKPLSAEGFGAAMGKGALWGGAAGGALQLSERALTSARSLFPKQQYTREAVDEAEGAFSREMGEATRDSDELARSVDQQVQIATERAMTNPDARARILEARARAAEANAARAELRLKTQQDRAAGIKPPKPAKGAPAALPDEQIAAAKAQINADMDAAMAAAPTARAVDPADILGPGPARAADPRPGATAPTDLEAALLGTKQRLDAGEDIASIGGRRAAAQADRAVADIVAEVDPAAAPLLRASANERMTRADIDDWISRTGKRARDKAQATGMATSYRNTLEAGPFGAASRKTDRLSLPVGDDAAFAAKRAADDAYFDARNARFGAMSDEALLADRQAKQAAGKARKGAGPALPQLADISIAPGPSADVAQALRGSVDIDADDLAEGIRRIGAHEAAAADLVDAARTAGVPVPPGAERRAAAYQEAVAAANQKQLGQAVLAGDAARSAAAPAGAAIATGTAAPGTLSAAINHFTNAGAAMEALQALGVPGIPDVDKIPVVGPLLGWFLKAKAASAAYRRLFGRGTLPQTAEGAVASRAARSRERVVAAVDRMFEVGAKGADAAAKRAPRAAAILGTKLFEGGKDDSGGDERKAFAARMDELARAQRPGALERAVRERVRVGDPDLLAAIIEAQRRKADYLAAHAPKRPTLPTALRGARSEWGPSRAEIQTFAAITEAVEDPLAVIERAAAGGTVELEAARAIRTVYPRLFGEAQKRLVERVMDQDAPTLPYQRRIQLSLLFDVPLDGTMAPGYISYLQGAFDPMAAPAMPAPGQPPVPGIAADLSAVGQATATNLDARAGG